MPVPSLRVPKVPLHPSVTDQIRKHSILEKNKGGYEAVGFVAVSTGEKYATATLAMHNHSPSPQEAFAVEAWEQFRAEKKLHSRGYQIVGIYHSHCNSEALPSQFDHKLAWPDSYTFIYSVPFDDLKAYHKVDGFLEPAEILYAPAS